MANRVTDIFGPPIPKDTVRESAKFREGNFFSSFEAAKALSEESAPLNALARMRFLSQLRRDEEEFGSQKLEPDVLNRMFPDIPLPFDRAMTQKEAMFFAQQQVDRQMLIEKIADGPQGFTQGAANFVGGIWAHATDPISLGADILISTVGTPILAASLAAKAPRAARAFRNQTILRNFGEGVAGGVISESISQMGEADISEADYDQIFANVVGGATLFAGIHYGARKLSGPLAKAFNPLPEEIDFLTRSEPGSMFQVHRAAVSAYGKGFKPKVEKLLDFMRLKTKAKFPEFDAPFTKVRGTDINKLDLYSAHSALDTKFDPGSTLKIGDDFGDAIYLSDDLAVMNGAAGQGGLFRHNVEGNKFIELSEIPDKKVVNTINSVAKKNGIEVETNRPLRETLRDLKDKMSLAGKNNTNILNEVIDDLRKKGFDGYLDDGEFELGRTTNKKNVVVLFDSAKAKPLDAIKPDPTKIFEPIEGDVLRAIDEVQGAENKLFFNKSADEAFEARERVPLSEKTVQEAKLEADELELQIQEMEKMGLLDANEKRLRELFKDAETDTKNTKEPAVKAAITCMLNTPPDVE